MNICSWKYEAVVSSIPNIYPCDQRWTCRAKLLCFYQLYLLGKKYWCTMYQLNLQYTLVMLALSYHRLTFRTQEKRLPLEKALLNEIDRRTDRQFGRVWSLRKRFHFLNHASLLIGQLQGNWLFWPEWPGISFLFLSRTVKLKKTRYSLLILYLNDYHFKQNLLVYPTWK